MVDMAWPAQPLWTRVSARVNPRYADLERNGADNLASVKLPPGADLQIGALSVAAAPERSGVPHATVSFRIRNAGGTAVAAPFMTHVSARQLPVDTGSTDRLPLSTPRLEAGQTLYVTRTIPLPSAGASELRIEVDPTSGSRSSPCPTTSPRWRLRPQAPPWAHGRSIGPRRILEGVGATGRLHAIAVHPTAPATLYVGSPGAGSGGSGVWKTTDGGASWLPIADSLPTLRINALGIAPSSPSRVYAATEGKGVFRSTDNGTSWLSVSTSSALNGGVMRVHPTNPDILYLTSRTGIHRSIDGGVTWTPVLTASGAKATDLLLDKANPSRLIAALYHASSSTSAGVYSRHRWRHQLEQADRMQRRHAPDGHRGCQHPSGHVRQPDSSPASRPPRVGSCTVRIQ